MEIVTKNSEARLVEMLHHVQQNPDDWLSFHINISPLHDKMLHQEGLSNKALSKIHAISMGLAQKLAASALKNFEGEILVFEDSDVLMLLQKTSVPGLENTLLKLKEEFSNSGILDMIAIEEMKDRIAQLLIYSEQKMETAKDYRVKQRAVEIGENLLEFTDPDPELTSAIQNKRRARSSSCILVIEDDILVRGLIAAMLEDDHEVILAKNAQTGVIAYIDRAPDVVFLDIHMPGLSGKDIVKSLKQIDPEAYIVMISGDSSPENVLSTKTQGAVGFLCKPFSVEKLQDYISKCPSLGPEALRKSLPWRLVDKDNITKLP